MTDSFSHLHVHTEFSMLDGASRVSDAVAAAAADGQPALGITDHGNMYGILDFYRACQAQGVKPVLGTEAYMAHDHRSERPPRRGRVDDTGGENHPARCRAFEEMPEAPQRDHQQRGQQGSDAHQVAPGEHFQRFAKDTQAVGSL